jgi:hypothetical protein
MYFIILKINLAISMLCFFRLRHARSRHELFIKGGKPQLNVQVHEAGYATGQIQGIKEKRIRTQHT